MLFFVPTARERRKVRARTWAGDVAHSRAEMEDADLEFWLAMDPVDRLKMVWSLVEDGLALQGGHGPTTQTSKTCWRSSPASELSTRCSVAMPSAFTASPGARGRARSK